jgi:hypothetical protein
MEKYAYRKKRGTAPSLGLNEFRGFDRVFGRAVIPVRVTPYPPIPRITLGVGQD